MCLICAGLQERQNSSRTSNVEAMPSEDYMLRSMTILQYASKARDLNDSARVNT